MTTTTDSNNGDDENKRIAEETEDIEIIIKQVKKDTSGFLLTVLQSIINEQIEAKQLKRDVGNYIYQAVKDQAIRKGWID
jgi:hypothetical protein